MKKPKIIFIVLFGLCLMACSRGPAIQTVELTGSVKTLPDKGVYVYGKSSLPENAIINGQLIELDGERIYVEKSAKTDKEGNFTLEMKRPELEQEYKLQVIFNPKEQEGEVKDSYGEKGQYIKDDSKGYVKNMNGTDVPGIVMYDHITKIITTGTVKQLGGTTSLSNKFYKYE